MNDADAPAPRLTARDAQLAHLLLRLALGVNILLHGAVRLPKLAAFAEGLTQGFAETWLPLELVRPFAYAIPIVEALVGALLIVGLFTREALVAGAALMVVLLAGTCIKEDWSTAGLQLIYSALYFALLATRSWERWSVDTRRRAR